MKKFLILGLISLIPMSTVAENMTASEADSMVTQMKTILDQYAIKIRALETENNILREEIRKAGIKIPLSVFSGAIVQVQPSSTGSNNNLTATASTSTGVNTPGSGGLTSSMIENLNSQFGERYTKFITRINTEWEAIQGAYNLPITSYIGGYEFIKQGLDNHVFVDIVFDVTKATNAYDAKILYEYNTGTYQRKLIGFFELDRTTGYYKTKSGNNPFAGVPRTFVKDPKSITNVIPPTISGTETTGTGAIETLVTPTTTRIPTFAEIEKAYTDKRYLSVISLSNTFLTANTATYDLLRIRYKTYFIIGKYTESLAEISKIESMGTMTKTVACDAQVIATYSKDTTLINKYTTACKK